jgi:hypothetical protein
LEKELILEKKKRSVVKNPFTLTVGDVTGNAGNVTTTELMSTLATVKSRLGFSYPWITI